MKSQQIEERKINIIPSQEEVSKCLEKINELSVDFIRFEQVDFNGIARSKMVPKKHFERYALNGLNVFEETYTFGPQGSLTHGIGFENGYSDSLMFPDCETFCVLPWTDKTARVYCLSTKINKTIVPIETSPRYVAIKQLHKLSQKFNLYLRSAFEYEFIVVNKEDMMPVVSGVNIFSTVRNSKNESLVNKIVRFMQKVGIDIITANTEYSPGQYEIVYSPSDGIAAADNASTFKTGIKEICQQENKIATFMTWPSISLKDKSTSRGVGNGGHFNHSVQNNLCSNKSENLFYVSKGQTSDEMRYQLGGLLKHAKSLQAFYNPTTNCYKRINPNTFAPYIANQGNENRLTSYRIKNNRPEISYIENRIPGATANPYLVLAATVAAGIHGLEEKIEPTEPVIGNKISTNNDENKLPTSLNDSLDYLEKDDYLSKTLGKTFVEQFIKAKRSEIDQYNNILKDKNSETGITKDQNKIFEYEMSQYFEFM